MLVNADFTGYNEMTILLEYIDFSFDWQLSIKQTFGRSYLPSL